MGDDGSGGSGLCDRRRRRAVDDDRDRARRWRLETVVLPKLRFRPRATTNTTNETSSRSSYSSLLDFHETFLRNGVPDSFGMFHETNRDDENVRMTPWEDVEDVTSVRRASFVTAMRPGTS